MTDTRERVEVTPQLLAELSDRASLFPAETWSVRENAAGGKVFGRLTAFEVGSGGTGLALCPQAGTAEWIAAACPAVVLALVARIRELEADLAEAYSDERLNYP